jgi:hypothetical protein
MDKKSHKHVFPVLILTIITVVAILLWGGLKRVRKESAQGINVPNLVTGNVDNSNATKTYLHSDESFSFSFPSDFTFSSMADQNTDNLQSDTLLFKGNQNTRNFQIHISSFDGTTLDVARIKRDIPSLDVEQPEKIAIDGAQGVAFLSKEAGSALVTREIWFVHDSKIYQVSTFKDFDQEMVSILSTWKWQQ